MFTLSEVTNFYIVRKNRWTLLCSRISGNNPKPSRKWMMEIHRITQIPNSLKMPFDKVLAEMACKLEVPKHEE